MKVVVWKTHWIGDDNDTFKDINDLIILRGLLQILEMINKNTYSGLRGEGKSIGNYIRRKSFHHHQMIEVHELGFVKLIDTMGDDEEVENAKN